MGGPCMSIRLCEKQPDSLLSSTAEFSKPPDECVCSPERAPRPREGGGGGGGGRGAAFALETSSVGRCVSRGVSGL